MEDENVKDAEYEIVDEDGHELCCYPTKDGSPCQKKVSEDHGSDPNRCTVPQHNDPDLDPKADAKEEILHYLKEEQLTIGNACRKTGYHPRTVRDWRQQDPEFDESVRKLKETNRRQKVQKAEQTIWQKIFSGEASVRETVYYLNNRADPEGAADSKQEVEVRHQGEIEHKRDKQQQLAELIEEYPELKEALTDMAEDSAQEALEGGDDDE